MYLRLIHKIGAADFNRQTPFFNGRGGTRTHDLTDVNRAL